jgi:Ras-related protein Rab-6A
MSTVPSKNKYKVVFVGNSSAGKTSLVERFVNNIFSEKSNCTIGVDFLTKNVELNDNDRMFLNLWDTSGQEKFDSILTGYFRGCDAAVIVYDVTDRNSFNDVEKWFTKIRHQASRPPIMFIVGTKADLKAEVTPEEAETLAMNLGTFQLTASAKTGENVRNLFTSLCQELSCSQGAGKSSGKIYSAAEEFVVEKHRTNLDDTGFTLFACCSHSRGAEGV